MFEQDPCLQDEVLWSLIQPGSLVRRRIRASHKWTIGYWGLGLNELFSLNYILVFVIGSRIEEGTKGAFVEDKGRGFNEKLKNILFFSSF